MSPSTWCSGLIHAYWRNSIRFTRARTKRRAPRGGSPAQSRYTSTRSRLPAQAARNLDCSIRLVPVAGSAQPDNAKQTVGRGCVVTAGKSLQMVEYVERVNSHLEADAFADCEVL